MSDACRECRDLRADDGTCGCSAGTVVTVLVVRHPDAANTFTVSAPEGIDVRVIDVDYGSGFDGYPRNADEADHAMDMVRSIAEQGAHLGSSDPVWAAIEGIVEELTEYAEEARS